MSRPKGARNFKLAIRWQVMDKVSAGVDLKSIQNDPAFSGSNASTLSQYFYWAKRELTKNPQ